jgi:hypothetical protein
MKIIKTCLPEVHQVNFFLHLLYLLRIARYARAYPVPCCSRHHALLLLFVEWLGTHRGVTTTVASVLDKTVIRSCVNYSRFVVYDI